MNSKHILIFIAVFMLSIHVVSGIIGVFSFATINLAGGESLGEVRMHRVLALLFSIAIFFGCYKLYRFLKNSGKTPAAWGMIIPAGLMMIASAGVLISMFWTTRFDAAEWNNSSLTERPNRSFHMALDLVSNMELDGQTLYYVESLLGPSSGESSPNLNGYQSMEYSVDGGWELIIKIKDERVVECELRQQRMMN